MNGNNGTMIDGVGEEKKMKECDGGSWILDCLDLKISDLWVLLGSLDLRVFGFRLKRASPLKRCPAKEILSR